MRVLMRSRTMANWYMARWGEFESPTPWFVARYSIQLSYQRIEDGAFCLFLFAKSTKLIVDSVNKNCDPSST